MSGGDGRPRQGGNAPPRPQEPRRERVVMRGLGVPALFAAAYSAVGFSIYFSLGVVAEKGLGLTPLI
ncbi:MAG TPA: hypothetical protein VFZ19_01940, partial [Solirubrobacterales bacterium]